MNGYNCSNNNDYPYAKCNCHRQPCVEPINNNTCHAGGFVKENIFMLINSTPFLYDASVVNYGQKIDVGENIFTRVTQRKDDSCVNLNAVFNMCDSSNTNTVLNHFLEQIIANKYDELRGILPVIKARIKFTIFFTIRDSNNMIVYEGNDSVVSNCFSYHSTSVKDYFVTSTRNLIITNIPPLEYQGLYQLTLTRIDAHVEAIDTSRHIVSDLNPYYQFINNNTNITVQHDAVDQKEYDETLLLTSADIDYTVNFQASLTTRLRVSFNAFMSNLISTQNTFKVWMSLYSPTDAVIRSIQDDIDQVKLDYTNLDTRVSILELSPKEVTLYTQGTSYVNGQIVWLVQGTLFQVTNDFTSDNTDDNTPEQSMIVDISNGNIVPVQTEPSQLP